MNIQLFLFIILCIFLIVSTVLYILIRKELKKNTITLVQGKLDDSNSDDDIDEMLENLKVVNKL